MAVAARRALSHRRPARLRAVSYGKLRRFEPESCLRLKAGRVSIRVQGPRIYDVEVTQNDVRVRVLSGPSIGSSQA